MTESEDIVNFLYNKIQEYTENGICETPPRNQQKNKRNNPNPKPISKNIPKETQNPKDQTIFDVNSYQKFAKACLKQQTNNIYNQIRQIKKKKTKETTS